MPQPTTMAELCPCGDHAHTQTRSHKAYVRAHNMVTHMFTHVFTDILQSSAKVSHISQQTLSCYQLETPPGCAFSFISKSFTLDSPNRFRMNSLLLPHPNHHLSWPRLLHQITNLPTSLFLLLLLLPISHSTLYLETCGPDPVTWFLKQAHGMRNELWWLEG